MKRMNKNVKINYWLDILPRFAESQFSCVALMNQCLPNVNVDSAVIVIDMEFVPSKSTTICCPEFSPHKFGTFEAPPLIDITSVLQTPSPFGGANDKSRNSTRSWHTVPLHGFTVNEHLMNEFYNYLHEIFHWIDQFNHSNGIIFCITYDEPPLHKAG